MTVVSDYSCCLELRRFLTNIELDFLNSAWKNIWFTVRMSHILMKFRLVSSSLNTNVVFMEKKMSLRLWTLDPKESEWLPQSPWGTELTVPIWMANTLVTAPTQYPVKQGEKVFPHIQVIWGGSDDQGKGSKSRAAHVRQTLGPVKLDDVNTSTSRNLLPRVLTMPLSGALQFKQPGEEPYKYKYLI